MGGIFSRESLISAPWRKITWGHKKSDLQYVNKYEPESEGQWLRILLYGPRGAGKSSFINSVESVLRDKICTGALVNNVSHNPATQTYATYKIQKGNPQTKYPFVLTDTAGMDRYEGVQVDDIKLALKGHVREGYMFNPESKLSEESEYYRETPTKNDKVHVLVCVVPADTSIEHETLQKIQDIRSEASRLGIPQVAIVTKVDQACPETKKDLRNIYRSKNLKEKMEEFSKYVGFPMNCIFPVQNYHAEIDVRENIDTLILSALKYIINYGDDFLNRTVV